MARPKSGTRFDAYKITCSVTGKAYIGATAQGVGKRFHQHMSRADNPSGTEFATFLSCDVRKHGAEAFSVEHIASARTFDDLLELEKLLIAQHGTLDPACYNRTMGGEGMLGYRRSPTEAERENIRAKLTGRKLTEERKQAIAAGMRAIMTDERRAAVASFHTGRKRSDETRAKMREGQLKAWLKRKTGTAPTGD